MSGITYKQLGDYLDLKITITIPGLPDLISKQIKESIDKNEAIKPLKVALAEIKNDITKLNIDFTSTQEITPGELQKIISEHIKNKIDQIPLLPSSIKELILFLINNITVKISEADKDAKTNELKPILKKALELILIKPPFGFDTLLNTGVDLIAPQIIAFMAMGAGSAAAAAVGTSPAAATAAPLPDALSSSSSGPAALGASTAPADALSSSSSGPAADAAAAPAVVAALSSSSSGPADAAAAPAVVSGTGGASRRSRCPRGSRRNKKTGDCVKVAGYTAKKRCPRGTRRSKTTGACEKFKMLLAKVDSSKRKTSAMLTKVADEALSEVAELKKADTELAAATKKCCAAASAAAALKRQKKTAANKARLDGKIAAAVARAELADKLEKEAEKDRADILAKIARLRKVMGVRKNEENPAELKRLIQQWTDESRVRIWKMSKE